MGHKMSLEFIQLFSYNKMKMNKKSFTYGHDFPKKETRRICTYSRYRHRYVETQIYIKEAMSEFWVLMSFNTIM